MSENRKIKKEKNLIINKVHGCTKNWYSIKIAKLEKNEKNWRQSNQIFCFYLIDGKKKYIYIYLYFVKIK